MIKNMASNLPTLRKKMEIAQESLATLIGVSRSTIATIESKKKTMTWNMFLPLVLIFTQNEETDKLLNAMEIYTDDLNEYIIYMVKLFARIFVINPYAILLL